MSYIYDKFESLVTMPPTANAGTGQCVAPVRAYAKVPQAALWRKRGPTATASTGAIFASKARTPPVAISIAATTATPFRS
ncbi:MAG TPA: hypothetical protein VGC36_07505 [Rhizomicrobium sp.]